MNTNQLVDIGIIQIISITLLTFIIVVLLRQSKALKFERRIGPFSLDPITQETSFFDKVFSLLWALIRKLSTIFNKSHFLRSASKKYEKYITFDEKDFKDKMDYISLKFVLAIGVNLLYFISVMFGNVSFNFFTIVITTILVFFLPNIYLAFVYGRKKKLVEDDLLRAISIMNNSFKSGSNVTKAVETVIDELDGPIKDEFRKIYIDINYGLSLDVVFNRFYERVKLDDAQYLTSSLSLLNKTGGNIVKVFSLIEKTFYDKKKLRNELRSLTASSVFVFRFLLFLPFVFILLILIFNPTYFNPLFKHTIGALVIGIIILLYIVYALVVKKVLKVNI